MEATSYSAQWQLLEGGVEALETQPLTSIPPVIDGVSCPCCGYKTLHARGTHEICPVCYWEDDGQDERAAQPSSGSPNGKLSLEQARKNFQEFKACDRHFIAHVRAPKPEEI